MLGPILVSVISALSPVFDTFGDTFAKVAEAAAPLIERIGVLANEALPVLVPVLQAVVTFLGSALVGVINGAIKAFDGIASVIQGFVGVVMGVVAILQGDFREGFSKIWSGLGKIVNGAFKLIVGIVQVWLNVGILSVVRKGVAKILTSWKSGWGGVEKAFMAVARWIRSAAGSLWSWLRSAVGKLMSGIKSLWQGGWTAIRNVAKTVWNAIKSTVTSVANSIRNGIKSFLSRIDDTWTASWNNVKDVLRRAWDAMKNIVSTAKDRVISTVRSLPAAIQSIFSGMGSLLVNAGRSLIDGLIGGISEKFQAVKDKLSGLTKMLPDWKGPAEKDAVLLKPAGQLLIDGLIDGFESRFGAVRKTLQSLTGDIQGQVSGVEGSLSNARIRASASVTHSVDTAASSGSANKTLIYNAAPGASLGTEEDLYAALDRGRAFDW